MSKIMFLKEKAQTEVLKQTLLS